MDSYSVDDYVPAVGQSTLETDKRGRAVHIQVTTRWAGCLLFLTATAVPGMPGGQADVRAELEGQFTRTVRPFLETYCITCHGQQRPAAQMDLSGFTTMAALMQDGHRWSQMLARLEAEEMPPKGARHPTSQERRVAVDWFHAVREQEMRRNAGDPGIVMARRLSNSEYDYTIRDLTGVDIRPAREFPVDPANTAGFDNSGETLTMSPTLLKKYLAAAREVAEPHVLEGDGICFATHPMLVETDRDKFAVHQIIDFYHQAEHRLRRLFSNRLALPASRGAGTAKCHAGRPGAAISRQRKVSGDRLVDSGEQRKMSALW